MRSVALVYRAVDGAEVASESSRMEFGCVGLIEERISGSEARIFTDYGLPNKPRPTNAGNACRPGRVGEGGSPENRG